MGNFRRDSRSSYGRGDRDDRPSGRFSRGPSRFDRGGRDGGRRSFEMHEVTCDKCGKQCEVPFKPTGDKPVFCSDCFRKNDSSSPSMSSEQIQEINEKLDKIMKALDIS
ncbi:MAG: hypothetical protein NT076_03290 [Candidatus Pacearchaeota archaeon]|nr:hypothetical protein [Candidatus Pacearchaeota archaeon]